MSTPASKPEFSKGVVEPVGDCGMFEAAIDHLTTDNNVMTPHGPDTDASKPPSDWGGRIVMYGKTAEQAEALRERILVALELCRGAEIEWLRGFNSNPHRLPVDQHIERAMGHAGAAEVELVRQVTDGGRNPRYEGLFEGESEEQRASRLTGDDDDQAYDIEAERLTYEALGPGAGINPNATSMDDIFLTESTGEVGERAEFEAWYLGHFYMGDKQCGLEWLSTEPCGGYRHQHPAEQWIVWQARAAISAPSHSEQVRDVSAMARVLSDRQADSCNVDRDDQWKIYGQDFIDDVTAMLAAPAAPAADAGLVDMYRHLQTVTPYRFKKIQDASVTDGGDVLYFHKDRFDAALLDDMAANCAKESK